MTRILPLLALIACSRAEHTITMKGMTFDPPVLTVEAGDLVVWRNADLVPHTATAAGRFDSGPVAPDASFRVTVGKPGELVYRCTLHPNMVGKLVVR